MGRYIDSINGEAMGSSFTDKCKMIEKHGGVLDAGDGFKENLVCVVNNGPFAAAGYAYSPKEFEVFKHPDGRPRRWYVLPDADRHAN